MPLPREPRPAVSPIAVPAGVPAVLLVGGQFDPPHRAHVELAALARDRVCLAGAWLVFVPAARSPMKAAAAALDADRLAMLRMAIAGMERAAIWTDELDRSDGVQPSYWIDTLRRAREQLDARIGLRFLIGADQAVQFHRWRAPREILAIAPPVVVLRAPWSSPEQLAAALSSAAFWTPDDIDRWRGWILETPRMAISSTAIRAQCASHEPERAEVAPAVARYIRDHHLYGS